MENSAFRLSRIYSQGWNAAKKLLADGKGEVDAAQAAAINPYRTTEEAARWTKGFNEALQSQTKPYSTPGGRPWRRAAEK